MSEKKSKAAKAAPADAIRAEIENLTGRKTALEMRKFELESSIVDTRAKRMAALAADGAADLAGFTRTIRDGEDEASVINDAIADLASAIDDAESRLLSAEESATRDASARKVEALASALAGQAECLQAAVDALAKAARSMMDACPADVALPHVSYHGRVDGANTRRPISGPMRPDELVSALIADALDAALPDLFQPVHPVSNWGGYSRALFRMGDPDGLQFGASNFLGEGVPVATALRGILLNRLEAQAAAIRSGDASTDLGKGATPDTLKPKDDTETGDVQLFCTRSFSFLADNGRRQEAPFRWTANVPADYAAEAVARGLAVRMDSIQGRATLAAEEVRRAKDTWSISTPRDPEGVFDLIDAMSEREAA
jgi:hypothetical protein